MMVRLSKVFMFDTNAIGELYKDDFDLPFNTEDFILAITGVQKNEIEQIPNQERKNKILEVSKLFESKPTSVIVWGYSKWGQGKFSSKETSDFYKLIFNDQKKQFPNKTNKNIIADAIIGATCLAEKFTLVTQDKTLKKLVIKIDKTIEVLSFEEFKEKTQKNSNFNLGL